MKIDFRNLVLCITHECNGDCDFCMRGEPQDKIMDSNIISKIFSQVSYINHLVITGGEPSIYPEGISWINYYAKLYGCKIGSFSCITNGLEYSDVFVHALNELYSYCMDKRLCKLAISTDQFHNEPDEKAKSEYKKLPYYSKCKNKGEIPNSEILSEGRAKENGIGRYSNPPVKTIYDYSLRGFDINIGDDVFINACGDVVLDADLSYKHQAERRIGNVMDDDIYNILKEHYYKIPDHWFVDKVKTFYKISLKGDINTFRIEPLEEETYYELPQEASVTYRSILKNIRICPMDFTEKTVPDDLELIYEDLPIEDNRCIGTKIYYKSSTIKEGRAVTVEVIRCPLTKGLIYDGNRK